MICPYCNSITPDDSRVCCQCSAQLPPEDESTLQEEAPVSEAPENSVPEGEIFPAPEEECSLPAEPEAPAPPKKGRLWPPALILAVMFAVGLTLFLCLGAFGVSSDAAMPWFTVRSGVLYFDESLYTGSSELTVPASIGGQAVTSVSDGCFAGCNALTTVKLPEGIVTIGSEAFAGCSSLRGIKLPETLTDIGEKAFLNCPKLEAICIPYSVNQVGSHAFLGCSGLRHIFYPGPIEAWKALNIGNISQEARVYCADGTYKQG